jgi:hypothetical protein
MGYGPKIIIGVVCAGLLSAQTAEELVSKNTLARGGIEKLKAIHTLRMSGKLQQGSFMLGFAEDTKAPDQLRQTVTLQGMNLIEAYDGSVGWRISPFAGKKDAELIGEDDLRGLQESADFYGPLVDYQAKGNRIEYLGHGTVDGDDAYRLKVTLKNGDIKYYYLDPETFLEIRTETIQFIHGSVRETYSEMGSYKLVNGVYFPFALESGSMKNPEFTAKIRIDKIEANLPLDDAQFQMPSSPLTAGGSSKPASKEVQ